MRFVGERLGEGRAKKLMTSHDKTDWRQKRPTTRYEDENGPLPVGAWPKSRLRAKKVRWYVEM